MKKEGKWKKGLYQVINNEKYVGKRPIVYRSSYEQKFMRWCDLHPAIKEWSSESLVIMYFNPLDGKMKRYYPDFVIKYVDKLGNEKIEVIEVKPYGQTIPPKPKRGKKKSTLLMETKTYSVNSAKWEAAKQYCKERDYTFRIVTERDLYH